MKTFLVAIILALTLLLDVLLPRVGFGQDRVRIGVPLFPTVSYPVFIAHERGFFEKNGLKAEIIRINSEPTTYQALIFRRHRCYIRAAYGSVKANRDKWVRFVKAYLEATQYMTTNKEGSIEVLKRIIPPEDKETLEHA